MRLRHSTGLMATMLAFMGALEVFVLLCTCFEGFGDVNLQFGADCAEAGPHIGGS